MGRENGNIYLRTPLPNTHTHTHTPFHSICEVLLCALAGREAGIKGRTLCSLQGRGTMQ